MKIFLTLTLAFTSLLSASLFGQTNEDPYPDCTTSSFRLSEKFMDAYNLMDFAQARSVLETWIDVCGLQEVTNRALLLVKLRENDVLEADYLSFQYPMLKMYLERRRLGESGSNYAYEYQRPLFGFIPIGRRYDEFTAQAFEDIGLMLDTEFEFLRRVYANDTTAALVNLAEPEYAETILGALYTEEAQATKDLPETHYSIFAGAWIPLNEDSFLGTHPEIGFSIGVKRRRWNYDFILGFRFLKSANPYLASRERNGPREETDKFFGGFLGGSAGYDLLQTERSEIQLSVQLAGDGWDMLEETADQEASSLFRLAISPGIQYRLQLKNETYLGLYTRYHHTNYRNSERIDFEVNPLSVGIIFGGIVPSLYGRGWR